MASASFENKLPRDYFSNSNKYQLKAEKAPTYDHFAAYFTATEPAAGSEADGVTLVLTENPSARVAAPSSPEDLVSNTTIQTELPEIQKIKAEILTAAPSDRAEQIALILNYLATHYAFDHEMMKNNDIRPLTTAEALQRKKGVCQHYSVIYTAIARALKIPTRIVVGLHFDQNGNAYHAWVESEIVQGQWQVIEPQFKDSLTSMKTRQYYPVARALFLEDKSRSQLDYVSELMQTKLVFSPVQ
jgi:transglutaminase-like putative cysteine protease